MVKVEFVKTKRSNDLNNQELYLNNDSDFSSFVGIRYERLNNDEKILIHYPRTLGNLNKLEKKSQRIIISKLLKSLDLSKKSNEITKDYSNKIVKSNDKNFPLFSYLWIWDDFKCNGRPFVQTIKNEINSDGKINWKKTINQVGIIKGNSPIYTNIFYDKKIISESKITEIYDFCLYKSLEMIIMITNLSSNFIHPIYKKLPNAIKKQYKILLSDLLNTTFSDEEKLRYMHMLNILDGDFFDDLDNQFVYGVNKYDFVFEKMNSKILGNVNPKEYKPRGYYCSSHQEMIDINEAAPLRIDTISVKGNNIYIMDSKFYEFGSLPATASIEKQLVYGEYAENAKGFDANNIYNIFLLPAEFDDCNIKIQFFDYAFSNWKKNDKRYEKIFVYKINLKYILLNYSNGYSAELFDLIIEDIKSRI